MIRHKHHQNHSSQIGERLDKLETFNLLLNSVARHAKASEFMFRPGIAALYAALIGLASWRAETGIIRAR